MDLRRIGLDDAQAKELALINGNIDISDFSEFFCAHWRDQLFSRNYFVQARLV